jgi:hypothetical protein
MQLQFDKTPVNDFCELVNQYPIGELRKPTRSTVPLLSFWRDTNVHFAWLLKNWNYAPAAGDKACFEFTVSSARSDNRPSHTDLMFISETLAVAVEGKWSEPRYPEVKDWLNESKYSNTHKVLEHWLGLIGRKTNQSLPSPSFGGIVYQMLHRTASVCSLPAPAVHVVYHCFGLDHKKAKSYAADLSALNSLLGKPANLRFFLLTTPLSKTEMFYLLEEEVGDLRRVDEADAAEEKVRTRLKQGGLFEFGDSKIVAM